MRIWGFLDCGFWAFLFWFLLYLIAKSQPNLCVESTFFAQATWRTRTTRKSNMDVQKKDPDTQPNQMQNKPKTKKQTKPKPRRCDCEDLHKHKKKQKTENSKL